jgi:hypothetical protein
MPRFLLSVIQPDGPAPPPQMLDRIMRDVDAVNREMDEAGVMVLRAGLSPAPEATVVRAKDGGMLVTDGPFAETKEHIGGFALIDVADRDAALAWAHKIAAATTLPIEVRAART